ncbi:hypothetical protein CY35_05G094700 [Sphagnum magellanicum]|nr:hypothetical protein CY35_05G094700 [Sphagnum magellanicum]
MGHKLTTNTIGSIVHIARTRKKLLKKIISFKIKSICCTGIDHQKVTQFAANIKSYKPPEIYKGKGIQYYKLIHYKLQ